MIKFAVLIAVFFSLFSINGQTDGLLWKISGNGLKKPSYLFGTVHIHCDAESINKPAIVNAIKACNTVTLELDLDDTAVLMAMYRHSIEKSSSGLNEILQASEYKSVDSASRILLNDSLVNLDAKSLMAVYTMMVCSESFLGCKGFPIDYKVFQMAKEAHKMIEGLETAGFQDSLIKSMSEETVAKTLVDFCRDLKKARNDFQKIFVLYDSQKVNALYNMMVRNTPELVYLKDDFLVKRNLKWLDFLKKHMASKSYFVAVGAAHLGSETGLIELLKKAGYTLTPVKF